MSDPIGSASCIHGRASVYSSAGSAGKLTALRITPSRRKSRTFIAVSVPTSSCASTVEAAMCGVATTCGELGQAPVRRRLVLEHVETRAADVSALRSRRPAPLRRSVRRAPC